MTDPRRRYRFVIDESFTPDTLPMWRLAEYMTDMADLLGEKSYVHFVQIEGGSTVLVQDVEHEAYPVRVEGNGRWFRDAMGSWTMKSFLISSWVPLEDATLSTVIAKLRQVPGEWKKQTGAMDTLQALRSNET